MSDQWWQKLKTRFKGDPQERKYIWALGTDSSVQQALWEGFGEVAEVMYDNGSTPLLSLGEEVLPDIILADLKLFRDNNLGGQIGEDSRLRDVPILVLTDQAYTISNKQLSKWGAKGIIYYPLDADELKLKISDFIGTVPVNKLHEVNIDDFKPDNLDEELRNLNQRQEPLPETPAAGQQVTQPADGVYNNELEKLLAEIDETPPSVQQQASVKKAETPPKKAKGKSAKKAGTPVVEQKEKLAEATGTPVGEQTEELGEAAEIPTIEQTEAPVETTEVSAVEQEKEAEMKADKKQEDASEVMADQEAESVPSESKEETAFPQMQSVVLDPAASAGGVIEQWFHSIAEEKITRIIAKHDFSKTIEDVARDVVPKIAEELVSKEIERIKRKIAGE